MLGRRGPERGAGWRAGAGAEAGAKAGDGTRAGARASIAVADAWPKLLM